MIKKLSISIAALALAFTPAIADEGMWLLPLLKKMNIGTMQEMGLELSAEDIYSINNTSLKDAIVQFGGGCTGEIISPNGLLVTNHHCGYSSIQKLSSVEHDYLNNGYWAMNLDEELPCEGLTVTFVESMTDVTKDIEKARRKKAWMRIRQYRQQSTDLWKMLLPRTLTAMPECRASTITTHII